MRRPIAILLTILALGACSSGGIDTKLEQTARDIVAMVRGSNCGRMSLYTAPEAETLWRQQIHGDLLESGSNDPIARVCFVLGTVEFPRSETMEVEERSRSGNKVTLRVSDDGETRDLALIEVGDEWKLDHEWALKQVQDLRARLNVLEVILAMDSYDSGQGRFTESATEIEDVTGFVFRMGPPGIATPRSPMNMVFAALGPDAQSVCVSIRSKSGELFMARQDKDALTSYERGPELPSSCPAEDLGLQAW
jgi:hypothetical protein